MKKTVIFLMVIGFLFSLTACQKDGGEGNPPCPERTDTPVPFEAQYIRTGGYLGNVQYPKVVLIRSVAELRSYYERNKTQYDLERRQAPAADSTVGFLDACDKYDAAFFEESILVMVLLEENSGSIRHAVDGVQWQEGKLNIRIDTRVPEAMTCDMAQWHILIELEAGVGLSKEEDVTVFFDEEELHVITCEDFSFSLVWNCYGISSYDSKSGTLVKTTDTDHTEDYTTQLRLTQAQMATVYDLIRELDVTSYPDEYDPNGNVMSKPPMTLILQVNMGGTSKTIAAKHIAITFESKDPKGQAFLTACKTIIDMLEATEEWKALPQYEHFYA